MSKLLYLLDNSEIGGRVRAVLTLVVGVIVAVIALLQGVADTLQSLPQWQGVGTTTSWVVAAIVFLGRFTKVGNKS